MKITIDHTNKNYVTSLSVADIKVHHRSWLRKPGAIKRDIDNQVKSVSEDLRNQATIDAQANGSAQSKLEDLAQFFEALQKARKGDTQAKRIVGLKTRGMSKKQIEKQAKKNSKTIEKTTDMAFKFGGKVAPSVSGAISGAQSFASKVQRIGNVAEGDTFTVLGSELGEALNIGKMTASIVSVAFPEVGAATRGLSLISSGLMKTSALKKLAPTATSARNVISKVNQAKKDIPMNPKNLVAYAKQTLYSPQNMQKFSPNDKAEIEKFLKLAENKKIDLSATEEYKNLAGKYSLEDKLTDKDLYQHATKDLSQRDEYDRFKKLVSEKSDDEMTPDELEFTQNFATTTNITEMSSEQIETLKNYKKVYEQANSNDFSNQVKGLVGGTVPGASALLGLGGTLKSKGKGLDTLGEASEGAFNELRNQLVGYNVAYSTTSPNEREVQINLLNLEVSLESTGFEGKFNKKTANSLKEILNKLPDYTRKEAEDYIAYANAADPVKAISAGEGGNINIDFDQPISNMSGAESATGTIFTGKEPNHNSDVFKFWTGQLSSTGVSFDDLVQSLESMGVWSKYIDIIRNLYYDYKNLFSNSKHTLSDWIAYKVANGEVAFNEDAWIFDSDGNASSGESKSFLQLVEELAESIAEIVDNMPLESEWDRLDNFNESDVFGKMDSYISNPSQMSIERSTLDSNKFDPQAFRDYLKS